ncbi:hypothetical protein CEXT_101341 [Caerostris extrusa]|uniref:Uncharacterized protein n=1 Tax=Caerostris extrusa TaxID=172846 RepID=A0AAV4SSN5_CAEEX|nr:hypothetical protein CEXT_101341 [Caerostris extrusa]
MDSKSRKLLQAFTVIEELLKKNEICIAVKERLTKDSEWLGIPTTTTLCKSSCPSPAPERPKDAYLFGKWRIMVPQGIAVKEKYRTWSNNSSAIRKKAV